MSDDETGGPKREPDPNAAIEAPLVSHDSSIGESYQKEGPNQAERFTHAYEKTADATEKISDANERIAAATIEAARAAVESAKANRMMVWVTIGLLIVTCFQAYYTTESLTQSERAITATIDASRLDQRAWVGVKTVTPEKIQMGKAVKVTLVMFNSGKSFAKDLKTEFFIVSTDTPFPGGAELMEYARKNIRNLGFQSVVVLAPNADAGAGGNDESPLTQERFDRIQAGKRRIYVISEITYKDIFGVPHYTRFFGQYDPKENVVRHEESFNDAN